MEVWVRELEEGVLVLELKKIGRAIKKWERSVPVAQACLLHSNLIIFLCLHSCSF